MWQDEYLVWNPKDFHDITEITLPPTFVWLPDFGIWNSKGDVYNEQHFKLSKVMVTFDGTMFWSPGGEAEIYCSLNLKVFPFDTQNCSIWIMPDKIKFPYLQLQSPDKGHYVGTNSHGTWEIKNIWTESTFLNYISGSYSALYCHIILKRKPLYFVLYMIIPCILLGFLNLFIFVLPFNSGEKVSLGSSVLMSFFIFMVILVDYLPQNSDSFPVFAIYLSLMIFQSVLSIICATGVLCIVNCHSTNKQLGRLQVQIYRFCNKIERKETKIIAKVGIIHRNFECATDSKRTPQLNYFSQECNEEGRCLVGNFLDKVCLLLFSAFFTISTTAFLISVL